MEGGISELGDDFGSSGFGGLSILRGGLEERVYFSELVLSWQCS